MGHVHDRIGGTNTEDVGKVSGRFLTDFFRSLERHSVPATQLLGDLPIPLDETGRVTEPVEWVEFVDFMRRLEHHAGGPEALEAYGERICDLPSNSMMQALAGLSASPYSLYRAASQWALRRAMPGVQARIKKVLPNRIEIAVQLADGLRPCPQLFHLATGGARTLPRLLGLTNAVVTAQIEKSEAHYQITVPASKTLWSRLTRYTQTVFSSGAILSLLEAQQLELHAKHDELQQAKTALAESERRHRTLTDAAVDVLCEVDEKGHLVYVSASVKDLIGYTPEQVTGSHFSLWIPGAHRERARVQFELLLSQPTSHTSHTVMRERVPLHTETGQQIVAELSLRPYLTPEGKLRMVGILRDESDRPLHKSRRSDDTTAIHYDQVALQQKTSATNRMTQIVEGAMVSSQNPAANFRWHETKKLGERIWSEFLVGPLIDQRELRIDLNDAPAIFWSEESLLLSALKSLLDWAVIRSDLNARLILKIEVAPPRSEEIAAIVFSITAPSITPITPLAARLATASAAPSTRPDELGSLQKSASRYSSHRTDLSLATARDAVDALGGELFLERLGSEGQISRLRLPQPQPQPADPPE